MIIEMRTYKTKALPLTISKRLGLRVAVDRERLKNDLRRFYDFSGKVVLYVGGRGGPPSRRLVRSNENSRD